MHMVASEMARQRAGCQEMRFFEISGGFLLEYETHSEICFVAVTALKYWLFNVLVRPRSVTQLIMNVCSV